MDKKIIGFGIALGIFGTGTLYFLDRQNKLDNHYCFAEKTYLSDQELIDAAIEKYTSRNQNSYKDLADFKSQHPNCCRITNRNKTSNSDSSYKKGAVNPDARELSIPDTVVLPEDHLIRGFMYLRLPQFEGDEIGKPRRIYFSSDSCGTNVSLSRY